MVVVVGVIRGLLREPRRSAIAQRLRGGAPAGGAPAALSSWRLSRAAARAHPSDRGSRVARDEAPPQAVANAGGRPFGAARVVPRRVVPGGTHGRLPDGGGTARIAADDRRAGVRAHQPRRVRVHVRGGTVVAERRGHEARAAKRGGACDRRWRGRGDDRCSSDDATTIEARAPAAAVVVSQS